MVGKVKAGFCADGAVVVRPLRERRALGDRVCSVSRSAALRGGILHKPIDYFF